MSAIREDFVGVVHVYVDGESTFLSAGDVVPEGVQVRDDVLAVASEDHVVEDVDQVLDVVADAAPEADTAINFEDMPAEGDSREVWNTYAESVGFNPSPYSKKEALIEALKNR